MAPATELIICPAVALISSRARNPHAPRHSPLMPHPLSDLVQFTPLGQGKAHSASLVANLKLISCYDISLSQLIRFNLWDTAREMTCVASPGSEARDHGKLAVVPALQGARLSQGVRKAAYAMSLSRSIISALDSRTPMLIEAAATYVRSF